MSVNIVSKKSAREFILTAKHIFVPHSRGRMCDFPLPNVQITPAHFQRRIFITVPCYADIVCLPKCDVTEIKAIFLQSSSMYMFSLAFAKCCFCVSFAFDSSAQLPKWICRPVDLNLSSLGRIILRLRWNFNSIPIFFMRRERFCRNQLCL